MGGYRFSNPNYSSMEGSIGGALNKAAGSVDNIAIAMLRSAKTPEERALMDAHQNFYNNNARKIGAEADGQEIANENSRDPLGAIAQAMFGGDRDSARTTAQMATDAANGHMSGPVAPQYIDAAPQIARRMDAVTMANLTDPKSIAKVMQNVLTEQQLGDMGAGRITPQDQTIRNYAAGNSANKAFDIDNGGLKLELGSGKVSDTSVSLAGNKDRLASANQHNAAAGMDSAHAGLYRAETQNEVDGTPGRTGGGRGAKGAESESQRMKREAENQAIDNARKFILDSGTTRDDLLAKDSPSKKMLEAALKPKIGVDDSGYQDFASKFGQPNEQTIAGVVQRAVALNGETTMFGGKKNDQKAIEQAVRREFKGIGVEDSKRLVAQALSGGGAQRLPVAGTPAQQSATVQQPAQQSVSLPAQAVSQLKEGIQTKFGNGQVWTLQNGKPARVQ